MANTSESRLEKLANQAADKAIKSLHGNGAIFDMPENFSFSSTEADSGVIEDGEAAAAFDIFDHCEDITKKGHQIQYVVKRNGEMLGIKYHPYSWEQLQKEFRGGQYQVVAKSLTTKRYLKSETRTLSDPIRGLSGLDEETETVKIATPPPAQGPNFMELFALFQNMSEKQRIESREAAREQAQSAQTNMMAFVEMMKSTQTGSQQMFFEIAKMTQAVSEKLAESQKQMFEKMESRFERVIDKIQTQTNTKPEKPEFGLLELMKLQQDSQEKGFQLFNKLSQIAEAKAAEKVELIEELKGDRPEAPAKEKSMTDSLIESMLPTITAALAAPQAVPAQTRSAAPVRRSLPRPTAQIRTTQTRPNSAGIAAQATPQAAKTATQGASGPVGVTRREAHVVRNSVGLPKIAFPAASATPAPTVAKTETLVKALDKEYFSEFLVPIYGECLLNQDSPELAATKTVAALEAKGHTLHQFLQNVSLGDMMGIVRTFELPDEANPWFEQTYAHLQTRTTNAVREHAGNT